MKTKVLAGLVLGLLAPAPLFAASQATTQKVEPGQPVTITVQPAAAAAPTADFTLYGRHGHVTPHRTGCSHTGGGYIDVQQPTPDVIQVTMTGVAVATGSPCSDGQASIDFDLEQCFEVVFEKPEVKYAHLSVEARVIGLLRSECKCGANSAEESGGCATITAGPAQVITVCAPAHSVAGGENLAINDHDGPLNVPVTPGKYTLHEQFHIAAWHAKSVLPCKPSSAHFAPDPALDPLWISYWDPFHGNINKDFCFQVTIKVVPDDNPPAGEEKKVEKKEQVPAPKPGL